MQDLDGENSKSESKKSLQRGKMDPTVYDALRGTLSRRKSDTRVYSCNTRLLESISEGDTAHINRLLAMGANPNATCRLNHVSACHIAGMYDNDVLDLLIKAGAESGRSDKLGRTPLHLAAWTGNIKQVAMLLNFPKDLRQKVVNKITPETKEELKRHSVVIHRLTNTPCQEKTTPSLPDSWSDGMDHNCKDIKGTLPLLEPGWTALHAASARAQHHCVQLLLAAGANLHAQDFLLRTPLDIIGCAHYMGHKIEVSNFVATIRLLLAEGGRLRNPNANTPHTPLHTAVELESEEAVEVLLAGGASATCLNNEGLTAMHICVKRKDKELLQLLANFEYNDEDAFIATIDTRDQFGFTVLRAAVNDGWTQGVYIALGAGASVTDQALDGLSPIHAAAALGNVDILQELLIVAKLNNSVDVQNDNMETALFIAIRHKQFDAVKLLLEASASITKLLPNGFNVFHEAAQNGNHEILEYLIKYDSNIKANIINCTDSKDYTPLAYAVCNNHPPCVKLLIDNGADVNLNIDDGGVGKVQQFTKLLHIAAKKNYYEIAALIIKYDIKTIQSVNSAGLLPLHEACCHGNREIVTLLLHHGADLSGWMNAEHCKIKITPIEMLMNNLSKPTDFMEEIFDDYISSQGINIHESNCKVTVNYGILVPNESDSKQMRVIQALINTGNRFDQTRLLLHPLVQSFLYLKWKVLLPFFYSMLVLHGFFVLALNIYVVSVFYYKDTNTLNVEPPLYLYSNIWKYSLYATVALILLQEIVIITIKSHRYLIYPETWLKLCSIALVIFLSRVLSWEEKTSPEWKRLIATLVLLFTWFEMMYLLSRFPDWGFYVLMFGKVAKKVLKILLSFVFLILGFSICFMIQFRAHKPFENLWASFVKTLVMMTSEYDYQQTVDTDYGAKDITASIIIVRIIFLAFLILVSVVLMNLIVGVAVNDVNYLEMIGNIERLKKQVEFITSLEDILCHEAFEKVFPKSLLGRWPATLKLKTSIVLWPRKVMSSFDRIFPATIKDAIFEKAQLQKKKMDEELGSMVFNIKLDQIHNAVVGSDENEHEYKNASGSDNTLIKIIKQIDTMHADIEVIKDILITKKRLNRINTENSIII